ncbi:Oxysterol-binding protein [Xylaria sp. FL1777]|nr:Oxysterol-binding protein [Xylaria sp. FL1777]
MTTSQTNFSQLKDFISYLATIKGDLSNITAPPFLLSPTSVTEIPASWASHHSLFLQPAHETSAANRALLVLKNFLCSLQHQLHHSSTDLKSGPKKPLNAFLGELFLGEFVGADGSSTRLVSEQVSHHPPVTACALYNRENGLSSSGYVAQETTFHPVLGVRIRQTGHAIVRDDRHGESHLRTLPTMTVRGLLSGHPYPELEGVCYVSSSSGYLSTIEFTGKTLGGGARNTVRAELTTVRHPHRKLFEITGQWSGRLVIRDCATDTVIDDFHVANMPTNEIHVRPRDRQSPWESRRAWAGVGDGIRAGDMQRVCAEKKEIEEAQRDMRRAQEIVHAEWPTVFFCEKAESPEFEVLARAIPDTEARKLERDRTAGVWEFVGADAAEALISEGVYHQSLEPTGQILEEIG